MYLQKLQKQKKLLVFLLLAGLVFGAGSVQSMANTPSQDAKTTYQTQTDKVQKEIDRINLDLQNINQNKETTQSQTLAGQVSTKQSSINEIDRLIIDTRVVIGQLDKQIRDNQDKIDVLNKELSEMVLQIQSRQLKKPITVIFSGKNMGSMISEIYGLSAIEQSIEVKKQEIDDANKDLKDTKEKNETLKTQLETTRSLLKSEQSGLKFLFDQTQGQESRYQSLLKSINEQKTQLESQLGTLEGEYLAELSNERSKQQYVDTGYTSQCSFEETQPLNVPPDYFTSPAKGYLTQPFHCGHDGIDIANDTGSDLVAVDDGEVIKVGPEMKGCIGFGCSGGFGNYIVIEHIVPSGQKVYSLYAHLQFKPTLVIGQKVARGQKVGLMGCTGYTFPYPCGVHIHFMLLSESSQKSGLGCRYGRAKCYNPLKYMKL